MKTIAVVGAGYVGLVSAACFAKKGNRVIVIERDEGRIEALMAGKVPFYEPGLDELVQQGISAGLLIFLTSIRECFERFYPTIIFSCVGTPSADDGSADLSAVWDVASEIGAVMHEYIVVVNKSTVPVGTTEKVRSLIQQQLQRRQVSIPFDVASNPEFLKEGDALHDCLHPDRIVIGVESLTAQHLLEAIYEPFLHGDSQLLVMKIPSAELTKYAANAMLATRISFMNQMAILAEHVGADIHDIKRGMATDPRIGKHFLNAGIGYGGSCFPKDVRALVHTGRAYGHEMSLVNEVDVINTVQRAWFMNKIIEYYHNNLIGKHIGVWGIAFKPETDDIRDAPALDVIKRLLEFNATVTVYDPVAMGVARKVLADKVRYGTSAHELLGTVDALVIVTEWREFVMTPPEHFRQLKDRVIFDGRNCFDPGVMKGLGLDYWSIGRTTVRTNDDRSATTARSLHAYGCASL